MIPGIGPFFYPWGMVGRIYKDDHFTLLHTKYESSGPCCIGGKIVSCFSMTSSGLGLYGPQGYS